MHICECSIHIRAKHKNIVGGRETKHTVNIPKDNMDMYQRNSACEFYPFVCKIDETLLELLIPFDL
jgi:hypothetical protein